MHDDDLERLVKALAARCARCCNTNSRYLQRLSDEELEAAESIVNSCVSDERGHHHYDEVLFMIQNIRHQRSEWKIEIERADLKRRDPVLRQLVIDVTDLLGQETCHAARARAYETAAGKRDLEWVRVFQDAYKRELRQLLQGH